LLPLCFNALFSPCYSISLPSHLYFNHSAVINSNIYILLFNLYILEFSLKKPILGNMGSIFAYLSGNNQAGTVAIF